MWIERPGSRPWVMASCVLSLTGCASDRGGRGSGPSAGDEAGTGAEDGDDGPGTDAGDDEDDAGGIPGGGMLCGDGEDPSVESLHRLTVHEYTRSLEDLFGAEAMDVVAAALGDLPPDGEDEGFANFDTRVSSRHVNGFYRVAAGLADQLVASSEQRVRIAGDCANDDAMGPDVLDTCLPAFVRSFGRRVYRRPLEDTEVDFYGDIASEAGTPSQAFRDVVFTMLMAPPFLYHLRDAGTPIGGREDLLALGPYEVAAKLSFALWQTTPDDALLDAAEDGELATEEGYAAQVDRLLADDRVRATITGFYDDWLALTDFGGFADTPRFEAFVGDVDVAGVDLYGAMLDEVRALLEHYTWEEGGSFADILTTDLSFTSSPELAALYGVAPWDGNGDPPRMPAGERSGLLTRAALLVTGDDSTGVMHRGAWLRRQIACQPLPLPDPNDLPEDALDPPPLDPDLTTRERFEAKTAAGECQSCHRLINPVGFALEAYDGLGRHRTQEDVYSDEGELIASVPIDTRVEISGLGTDGAISGPVELMEVLAGGGASDACFAQQYFEFAHRRPRTGADACLIEDLRDTLRDEGIRAVLRRVVMQPEFRVQRVEEET